MKILQIGTADNSGGAASVSWFLKKGLEKKGYQMPMFVADKRSMDIDVHKIPRKINRYFQVLLSNDIDFSKTDWILNTEEFKQADIVHIHNIHGWFFNLKTLEKMSKIKPVVWTLHDMWAITPHCAYSYDCEIKDDFYQCPSRNSYPPIFLPNEKYLCNKKRKIYQNSNFNLVVPSLWLKEKIKKSVLKNKDLGLIYNGIDENIFKRLDKVKSRQELNLPTDKKIVLFLSDGGKNNPAKGWSHVESVVKNFKEDNNIIFLCIGGKEDGKDEMYNNLSYIKKTSSKELLSKYFSASNIFLFPSLADNCPLVILEAMACGIPIVTFETGGIPELVEHSQNGYIAKYKNDEDLINGVNYILNLNNTQIESIAHFSRQKIEEKFTINKMIDQYEILYKKLIESFKL